MPEPQILPVPHGVPSGLLDQSEVLTAGRQIWQAFNELLVPLPTTVPAIQQPLSQVPPLHTCPAPQPEPFARVVQEVTAEAVWHDWQAFAGFAAPFG